MFVYNVFITRGGCSLLLSAEVKNVTTLREMFLYKIVSSEQSRPSIFVTIFHCYDTETNCKKLQKICMAAAFYACKCHHACAMVTPAAAAAAAAAAAIVGAHAHQVCPQTFC
jgi:hypothetical protein